MRKIINNLAPRYFQIYQHFAKKIEAGELKEGEKLPTEGELCQFFNVSRITVRQALNELTGRGYVIKK